MSVSMVSPTGRIAEGLFRRRMEATVARDGKAYVREHTWTVGLPSRTDSMKLLRKDLDAVYSIDESVSGSTEQVEIVLPLKLGLTWQQRAKARMLKNEVVGVETVDAAGKTYENCYHIRVTSSDGSYTEDFWEAPRVGNVKSILTYSSGLKVTVALTDFKAAEGRPGLAR